MESLHYLLMRAHMQLNRIVLSQAAELGLTSGQPKVLEFLHMAGESDQKSIAGYCEIQPATVGSILGRMESAGLISRRQKDGNRRSLFVSLTPKGERFAEKMDAIFAAADKAAAASLSAAQLDALKQALCAVSQSLSEAAGPQQKERKANAG